MDNTIYVNMLGEFSLAYHGETIDDSGSRSNKLWLFLAYMLCSHGEDVYQREVVELLWGKGAAAAQYANSLKASVHRVRALLEPLGGDVASTLISSRRGVFRINPLYNLVLDISVFDALCARISQAGNDEERLSLRLRAIELYGGDFLCRLGSGEWAGAQRRQRHAMYMGVVTDTLEQLYSRGSLDRVRDLCLQALRLDPGSEALHFYLMRALLDMGRRQGVIRLYAEMCCGSIGVSARIRALYREALHTPNSRALGVSNLLEQLRERDVLPEAYVCEYDLFKVIYQIEARSASRRESAVWLALLTLSPAKDEVPAQKVIDDGMDCLDAIIRQSLRRGDIASQCSDNQYVILLPLADMKNSRKIARRIISEFSKQCSGALTVHFSVEPIQPI